MLCVCLWNEQAQDHWAGEQRSLHRNSGSLISRFSLWTVTLYCELLTHLVIVFAGHCMFITLVVPFPHIMSTLRKRGDAPFLLYFPAFHCWVNSKSKLCVDVWVVGKAATRFWWLFLTFWGSSISPQDSFKETQPSVPLGGPKSKGKTTPVLQR